MKCPYCGSYQLTVVGRGQGKEDSKRWGYYKRRRLCLSCNHKFWTVEEAVIDGDTLREYRFGEDIQINRDKSCATCEYENKYELEKPCIVRKKDCPYWVRKGTKI